VTVKRVLPLTRRMSLTFIVMLLGSAKCRFEYSPQ
jgi:hypothetical protein